MRDISPGLSLTFDRNTKSNRGSLVVVACALAFLVAAAVPVAICDRPLFSVLNGYHSPWSDQVWLALTTLGDGFLLAIILGAFVLINPRVTLLGLGLMLASSAAVHAIKWTFPLPRPAEAMEWIHVVGPLLRHSSFPSGHSAAAFSAALAVAYYRGSAMGTALILTAATLVAVSRIFVGAHFPLDVIGGAVCSLTTLLLGLLTVWKWCEPRISDAPRFSSRVLRIFVWVEIVAAAFGVLVYAPLYAESAPVAAVVAGLVLVFVISRFIRLRAQSMNNVSTQTLI